MADSDFATKTCTVCADEKPASLQFFGFRKEGRLNLRSACKSCEARVARERRATDPEYRARHVAAVIKSQKKRMSVDAAYKEKVAKLAYARNRRRRADPEKRERELAQDRAWRKANWDRVKKYKHKSGALQVAHVARRNAAKLRATPHWSEKDKIAALYEEARRLTLDTGVEHNVDHIVPLRGRTVCGLHVFANLRIVTEFENKSKSNKLLPELCGG